MLIAPHIQGETYCPEAAADPKIIDEDAAAARCAQARSWPRPGGWTAAEI
jgi:hypothetical protein